MRARLSILPVFCALTIGCGSSDQQEFAQDEGGVYVNGQPVTALALTAARRPYRAAGCARSKACPLCFQSCRAGRTPWHTRAPSGYC